MENLIQSALVQLGLSSKEIKLFLYVYKVGPTTINDAAKGSKLERSTAYILVTQLIEKGFIQEDFKTYKKLIIAVEPKTILRMLEAKERAIGRKGLEVKEKLSELQALYQASEYRPKVQVFEGKEGLLKIMDDILSSQNDIVLWTNQETEDRFFSPVEHRTFIQRRIHNKQFIRVLVVDNLEGNKLKKYDKDRLRYTKLLPADIIFTGETYVYGHKVAMIDYKKDIIGVIIQSEQIASSQKAIFELAWESVI